VSPEFEPLIDCEKAAELLGIHPKTLQQMARQGRIPAKKVGRSWRFRTSELDAWLRSPSVNCGGYAYRLEKEMEP